MAAGRAVQATVNTLLAEGSWGLGEARDCHHLEPLTPERARALANGTVRARTSLVLF